MKQKIRTILDSSSFLDGKEVRVTIKARPKKKRYWEFDGVEEVQKLIERIESIVRKL